MTERLYFTSPDPDYIFEEGARVAPNEGSFPIDATVEVETESHFLTFEIKPKTPTADEFSIILIDAVPPLSDEPLADVIVQNDILKKDQEFKLQSTSPRLASQAFKAIRIFTNIEQIVIHL